MTTPQEEFSLKITGADHMMSAEWIRPGARELGTSRIDLDSLRLRTTEALVGLLRRNRLQEYEELKLLGEYLFRTLFESSSGGDNPPGALLRQAIRGRRDPDQFGARMLRVSLEIDEDNGVFASWPWEYLFVPKRPNDPDSDIFLSRSSKMMLSRRTTLNTADREIHVQPPLRVLFAALSPEGLPVEYESILEMFLELEQRDPGIKLRVISQGHAQDGTPYEGPGDFEGTTYPAFIDAVTNFAPHVIHIIGHGRYVQKAGQLPYGQLAFPESAKPQWVNDWDLAAELMESPELRLVFLQACETAAAVSHPHAVSGMANSLAARDIPAVIGMHFQVQSAMANKFARAFYEPLMEHKSIEVAMHAGRRKLQLGANTASDGRNFGMPVLYLRDYSPLLVARSAEPSSKGGGFTLRGGEVARAYPFEPQRAGEPEPRREERVETHRSAGRTSGERNYA